MISGFPILVLEKVSPTMSLYCYCNIILNRFVHATFWESVQLRFYFLAYTPQSQHFFEVARIKFCNVWDLFAFLYYFCKNRVFFFTWLYVKSARIRSFSGPYFPVFGLNTFQPKCGKMRTRRTPNTVIFRAVWYTSNHTVK